MIFWNKMIVFPQNIPGDDRTTAAVTTTTTLALYQALILRSRSKNLQRQE
jgi:hypothetical protein